MLLPSFMDPEYLLGLFGPALLWVAAIIIFAECGLFAILPGDSLLFAIGLFTARGDIPTPLWLNCLVLTICAVAGNACGYGLGRVIGPALFKPRRGLMGKLFKQEYVDKTHVFFEKYGSRALILARFVPIVRTFVTLVAGVGKMHFGKFIVYTAIGGVIWACGLTILGYLLGNVKFIQDNLEVVLILIVLVSIIPMVVEYVLAKRRAKAEASAVDASS
ncbi:MAG: VTT domain-containing protein [Propionibacteriales bacterium]|nr:VTT domain-containing protein [Propionibacteriales bacterium]